MLCPKCTGEGYLLLTCPSCNGRGQLGGVPPLKCPRCDGRGKVVSAPCLTCGRTGHVPGSTYKHLHACNGPRRRGMA